MAEPVWDGVLRLSPASCPVHLRPATTDRKRIRLERLNFATGNPVEPAFRDARTGELVMPEATIAAYRCADGHLVTIADAESQELAGAPSQVIELEDCVPMGSIDRLFFEQSHYVYAAEPAAADMLYAIREGLLRHGRAGLGWMHIGGRQRRVLLEPRGAGLMLTLLRSAEEVEEAQFEGRAAEDLPEEAIATVESVIARRSITADPSAFGDPYEDRLRALLAKKLADAETASPASPGAAAAAATEAAEPEPGCEIFLSLIGLGERRHVGGGWAGTPGSRQPIEALSIRPREGLARDAIEFRVFGRDGRATSWVSDGNYAGSWGRQLPLTGFAVRPTAAHRGAVEIVYEGCFCDGGVVGPKRDGEVCASPIADDPLEAVRVSIRERAP